MKPKQPSDEVAKQILKLIRPHAEKLAKEREKEKKEKGHADLPHDHTFDHTLM